MYFHTTNHSHTLTQLKFCHLSQMLDKQFLNFTFFYHLQPLHRFALILIFPVAIIMPLISTLKDLVVFKHLIQSFLVFFIAFLFIMNFAADSIQLSKMGIKPQRQTLLFFWLFCFNDFAFIFCFCFIMRSLNFGL